ncbi:Xylosidase: arabinofuranosidase protein [Mycena kentingensis (nom. inval.)]|nr:Xylosidase: arabinofuranosidase protein [Mycena kentingensis (nom. inval.)]
MLAPLLLGVLATLVGAATRINPAVSGWHSDPSCVFVPEWDDTFFCVTSTFLVTPGIPVHVSKDLVNWRLASHALSRETQWPHYNTTGQNSGIFAVTLRYREGVFYAITFFVSDGSNPLPPGLLFKTTNPFDDAAWSDPVLFSPGDIDPDLFWDDDGTPYVVAAQSLIGTIDLDTGARGPITQLWNGTGERNPEGPHLYRKDGWYYLLIAEGGTELNHTVTMARSRSLLGTYEGFVGNPVLTNKNTDEYFQTVGHADIFQDGRGQWWVCALATRSGPEWLNYPMGREMVITPAIWPEGEFPVISPVRGRETAPSLPVNKNVRGRGAIYGSPEAYDFPPGSSIPPNFAFWRWRNPASFAISPPGHPHTLRILPSPNISSETPPVPISLVTRLQTDTLFEFSADISYAPAAQGEEAGVTAFLTQFQHIDLGIVKLSAESGAPPQLRLRTTGGGNFVGPVPEPVVRDIPRAWRGAPITLSISATNDTHYTFAAGRAGAVGQIVFGSLPGTILSGGSGPFTGTLLGAYATSNEGPGTTPVYVSRWRYTGVAQKIDNDTFVPSY